MSVKLQKGQKVSLSKENAGLSRIIVGLGWDEVEQKRHGFFAPKPKPIDCDAFALLLKNGKLGDNLTGEGEGDDEQIMIDLNQVPSEYDRIVIAVNIYQAEARNQHFGMIKNAFVRLVDARNNNEMCIYNLTENYSGQTAMLFGEVYRYNGEWKFSATGQGTSDKSIGDFAKRYL